MVWPLVQHATLSPASLGISGSSSQRECPQSSMGAVGVFPTLRVSEIDLGQNPAWWQVLLMGQYSTGRLLTSIRQRSERRWIGSVKPVGAFPLGKSTFIRHLLQRDYPGLRIGSGSHRVVSHRDTHGLRIGSGSHRVVSHRDTHGLRIGSGSHRVVTQRGTHRLLIGRSRGIVGHQATHWELGVSEKPPHPKSLEVH